MVYRLKKMTSVIAGTDIPCVVVSDAIGVIYDGGADEASKSYTVSVDDVKGMDVGEVRLVSERKRGILGRLFG